MYSYTCASWYGSTPLFPFAHRLAAARDQGLLSAHQRMGQRQGWHGNGPLFPMFATAPTRRPPALPPSPASRSLSTHPESRRKSAQAMKSVNVFFLFSILPSSYQARPISPPPRMRQWRRQRRDQRREIIDGPNPGSLGVFVRSVPVQQAGVRSIRLDTLPVGKGRGNPCSVLCPRPFPSCLVPGPIIVRNFLLLEQRGRSIHHRVGVNGGWLNERGQAVVEGIGLILGVIRQFDRRQLSTREHICPTPCAVVTRE